jgi:hypothetical protein
MHDLFCKACTDRGLVHSGKKNFQQHAISAILRLDGRQSIFIRDSPIFSSERRLHKEYYRKGSVEKIFGRESQGA